MNPKFRSSIASTESASLNAESFFPKISPAHSGSVDGVLPSLQLSRFDWSKSLVLISFSIIEEFRDRPMAFANYLRRKGHFCKLKLMPSSSRIGVHVIGCFEYSRFSVTKNHIEFRQPMSYPTIY